MSEPSDDIATQTETEEQLSGLSYEGARAQLIEVVTQLESGGVPLDESLALWERGEQLARVCQRWLDGAQAKVDAARADQTDPSERQPQR